MDYGYLNFASLLLGVVAIIIPLTQKPLEMSLIKIITSFSLSLIAIGCQIVYQNHLVKIEDFSAIADTMGSVLFASTTLIVLTILMNLLSVLKIKKIVPISITSTPVDRDFSYITIFNDRA